MPAISSISRRRASWRNTRRRTRPRSSPAFQNIDPDGYYYVTWAGLVAIIYNTDKVKAADAPKNWPDLLDPKWKDQVAVGSPSFSGMVGVWTVSHDKLYGWEFFDKLTPQKPAGRPLDRRHRDRAQLGRAHGRAGHAGDRPCAAPPRATRSPSSIRPTARSPSLAPSGVIKGAKNPNAAKLFVDFLLGFEYSKLVADNFEQSLRPEVPPAARRQAARRGQGIGPTVDEITKDIPGAKEKWKETFGM